MECILIKGFNGGDLFYVPDEEHLYVRKSNKKGKKYLACYHTVKSGKDDYDDDDDDDDEYDEDEKCLARCTFDEDSSLVHRNSTPHSNHRNHEITFRDLQSLNAMRDHCRYLSTNFPFSARKIPIKEIFLAEMVK